LTLTLGYTDKLGVLGPGIAIFSGAEVQAAIKPGMETYRKRLWLNQSSHPELKNEGKRTRRLLGKIKFINLVIKDKFKNNFIEEKGSNSHYSKLKNLCGQRSVKNLTDDFADLNQLKLTRDYFQSTIESLPLWLIAACKNEHTFRAMDY